MSSPYATGVLDLVTDAHCRQCDIDAKTGQHWTSATNSSFAYTRERNTTPRAVSKDCNCPLPTRSRTCKMVGRALRASLDLTSSTRGISWYLQPHTQHSQLEVSPQASHVV